MEYVYKSISDEADVKVMVDNMRSNITTINLLENELERIKLANSSDESDISYDVVLNGGNDVFLDVLDDNDENKLIEEIQYYYSRVKSFKFVEGEEVKELLKKELPSKLNSNYWNIIVGINVFLVRDINEVNEFIENEKGNFSLEELNEFKKEIVDIKDKIGLINMISREKVDTNIMTSEEVLNNIVFLCTESGNVYAMDDLDNNSVPIDFYEGFLELLRSIENGTFKNVEFLTGNNNKASGAAKVKGFKKRIIFDRVGSNTYVIIGAFVKKSDKDKSYLEPLKNRISVYRRNRDKIVEDSKNQEYLDSQKEILEKIYKLLDSKKKKREL